MSMFLSKTGSLRIPPVPAILASAIFLAGCGSLHLHDPKKMTLAGEAKTEFSDVKLAHSLESHKANFDALENQHVAALQTLGRLDRDQILLNIIGSGKPVPAALFDQNAFGYRLSELGLENQLDTLKVRDALGELETSQNELKKAAKAFTKFTKKAPPACWVEDMVPATVPQEFMRAVPTQKTDPKMTDLEFANLVASTVSYNDDLPMKYTAYREACLGPAPAAGNAVAASSTPFLKVIAYLADPSQCTDKRERPVTSEIRTLSFQLLRVDRRTGAVPEEIPSGADSLSLELPSQSGTCLPSSVGDIVDEAKRLKTAFESLAALHTEDFKKYRDALAAANAALKQTKFAKSKEAGKKDDSEEQKAGIGDHLKTVTDSISQLDQMSSALGVELALSERLKSITALINGFTTGAIDESNSDSLELQRLGAVVRSVKSLNERLGEISKASIEAQALPLLTQQKIDEARLQWAREVIGLGLYEIDLRFKKLLAYKSEAQAYRTAGDALCRADFLSRNPGFSEARVQAALDHDGGDFGYNQNVNSLLIGLPRARTNAAAVALARQYWHYSLCSWSAFESGFSQLTDTPSTLLLSGNSGATEVKSEVLAALVELSSSTTVLGPQVTELSDRLGLSNSQKSLAQARKSLRMWHALIEGPLRSLNIYHSGGVKAETLADLIVKAAGFTAVGIGTN